VRLSRDIGLGLSGVTAFLCTCQLDLELEVQFGQERFSTTDSVH
jgi:hypothetical protein